MTIIALQVVRALCVCGAVWALMESTTAMGARHGR